MFWRMSLSRKHCKMCKLKSFYWNKHTGDSVTDGRQMENYAPCAVFKSFRRDFFMRVKTKKKMEIANAQNTQDHPSRQMVCAVMIPVASC